MQERHEDIKRVAETLIQLQQLFEDMAMLVEQQDPEIQNIEATAVKVEKNVQKGTEQVGKASVSAAKARKKRICCFWFLLVIALVVIASIAIYVLQKNGKL